MGSTYRWGRYSAWGVYLALLPSSAFPLEDTGRIAGRVLRPDDSAVAGVSVIVNEISVTSITSHSGAFSFGSVPAGNYSVTFLLGANLLTRSEVRVTADQTTVLVERVDWETGFVEDVTVDGASRRTERLIETPAAVSVVEAEEIGRKAAHAQAPKLLEFTPGADVTQSGIYDFNFNTRGFNSSLNRRVATLVDGRDPSIPFLGAQEWSALSFPLDDLARVEMVRGPSASLYGPNASSGVLNMVSKEPRYSQGGAIRVTAGQLDTLNLDFRLAEDLGNDWYIKLVGGLRHHGDYSVSRNETVEYSVPCTTPGQTDCLPRERVPLGRIDDDRVVMGGVRFDKYLLNGMAWTLEGGFADSAGPVLQTGTGRNQVLEVQRPWARINWSSERFNIMGDYTGRNAPKQLALGSGLNRALDSWKANVEAQANWRGLEDRVNLVAGGSYRHTAIDSKDPETGQQTLLFEPLSEDQGALFAQVEWLFTERVKILLAGRYDEGTYFDAQFSPKVALVYDVGGSNWLRLTYSEAFQVATLSELFAQVDVAPPVDLSAVETAACTPFGVDCGFGSPSPVRAMGNATLATEHVQMLEIGYRGVVAERTYVSAEYYVSQNQDFITDLISQIDPVTGERTNPNFPLYQPPAEHPDPNLVVAALRAALPPPLFAILSNNVDDSPVLVPVSLKNVGEVDTQGVDIGLSYFLSPDWNVSFTYSWFDFEIQEETLAPQLSPNAPAHKLAAGVDYTAPRWAVGVSFRWVDGFPWAVGPFQGDVLPYTVVDLTGNYSLTDRMSIGLNWANVLDNIHYESFGGDLLRSRALVSLTLRW